MSAVDEKMRIVTNYNSSCLSEAVDENDVEVKAVKSFAKMFSKTSASRWMEADPVKFFNFLLKSCHVSGKTIRNVLEIDGNDYLQDLIRSLYWKTRWQYEEIETALIEDHEFRKGMVNLFFEGYKYPKFIEKWRQKRFNVTNIIRLSSFSPTVIKSVLRKQSCDFALNPIDECLDGICFEKNVESPYEKIYLKLDLNNKPIFVLISKSRTKKVRTTIDILNTMKWVRDTHEKAKCWLFLDGQEWLKRVSEMRMLVDKSDDVFTFHPKQVERFKRLVRG